MKHLWSSLVHQRFSIRNLSNESRKIDIKKILGIVSKSTDGDTTERDSKNTLHVSADEKMSLDPWPMSVRIKSRVIKDAQKASPEAKDETDQYLLKKQVPKNLTESESDILNVAIPNRNDFEDYKTLDAIRSISNDLKGTAYTTIPQAGIPVEKKDRVLLEEIEFDHSTPKKLSQLIREKFEENKSYFLITDECDGQDDFLIKREHLFDSDTLLKYKVDEENVDGSQEKEDPLEHAGKKGFIDPPQFDDTCEKEFSKFLSQINDPLDFHLIYPQYIFAIYQKISLPPIDANDPKKATNALLKHLGLNVKRKSKKAVKKQILDQNDAGTDIDKQSFDQKVTDLKENRKICKNDLVMDESLVYKSIQSLFDRKKQLADQLERLFPTIPPPSLSARSAFEKQFWSAAAKKVNNTPIKTKRLWELQHKINRFSC